MSSASQQRAQKSPKAGAAKRGRKIARVPAPQRPRTNASQPAQAREPAAAGGRLRELRKLKPSVVYVSGHGALAPATGLTVIKRIDARRADATARIGTSPTAIMEFKANIQAMNVSELVALVGEVMSSQAYWKHLRASVEGVLRAAQLAPTVEAALVDADPRILNRLGDDLVARARIIGEAKRALLAEAEKLSAADVSRLLGSRSDNPRQYASRLRSNGELLALPVANQYVYPAFQIDVRRKRVHPEIKMVGDLLSAADDPWGVLSWWESPNSRIGDRRPRDLLGTAEAQQLRSLAEAVVEPVG